MGADPQGQWRIRGTGRPDHAAVGGDRGTGNRIFIETETLAQGLCHRGRPWGVKSMPLKLWG